MCFFIRKRKRVNLKTFNIKNMRSNYFGKGGFHGEMPFGKENFGKKWSAMSDEEKKDFVEKRVQFLNDHFEREGGHFGHQPLTVENVNEKIENWQKMSDEEKAEFVRKRNEHISHWHRHFHGCMHRGF